MLCTLGRLLRLSFLLSASVLVACGGDPASRSTFVASIDALRLAHAPRVAAAADGGTWLVWAEGDSNRPAVLAARFSSKGTAAPSTMVAPAFDGAVGDLQITMAGDTPVVTWRSYALAGVVMVQAAAWRNGTWMMEFAAPGSVAGSVTAAAGPAGSLAMSWMRVSPGPVNEIVAATRAPAGSWSAPALLRSVPAGQIVLETAFAVDEGGGVLAAWTEGSDPAAFDRTLFAARSIGAPSGGEPAPVVLASAGYPLRPAAVSPSAGNWLVAWGTGSPSGITAVFAARFAAGAWTADPPRVDRGEDDSIRDIALTGRQGRARLAWVGLPPTIDGGSVRASSFDSINGVWNAPVRVDRLDRGYPASLRATSDTRGDAIAIWEVSQGDAPSPRFAATEDGTVWQAASALDPSGTGVAPDVASFGPEDAVATWYRPGSGFLFDIVVRRFRTGAGD